MPGVQVESAPISDVAAMKASANFNTDAYALLGNVKPKLLINNEWVDSVSGKTFAVRDPRNEEIIFQAADAQAEDVDLAVKAARNAFDHGTWPRMGGAARGKLMYKLAELIEANIDELAALESLDNGKPVAIAKAADIQLTADHFRYYAGFADKIGGHQISPSSEWFGERVFAYTLHEPIGVVGQVIPWNFPALMLAWKAGPALACGNCVIIKPAEQTPLTALRLGELAVEAGFPPGVFQIVTGFGPTAGAPLIAHAGVDKVAFTGSTEVGKIIMKAAADHVKDITLELGGKSALIVAPDANIDEACGIAHEALFFNHGQCCVAGSRLFVHSSMYDAFVEKAGELARSRKVGDPFDSSTQQGPQVDQDQLEKILRYCDLGRTQGARCVAGGGRWGNKGYWVQPTVFADVTPEMDIYKDEIFGPVQSIIKYDTLDEAIKLANESDYGLAAGVISNDINTINHVTRALKAGTVWVNTYNMFDNALPFGGYKQSGIGRDKGEYALKHYTACKCVVQKLSGDPVWF